MEKITLIIDQYKQQGTWKDDIVFRKESFGLLQNILEEARELEIRVPYENLTTTESAKTATK